MSVWTLFAPIGRSSTAVILFKGQGLQGRPLESDYLVESRVNKAVAVGHDYPSLLRARRRRESWSLGWHPCKPAFACASKDCMETWHERAKSDATSPT